MSNARELSNRLAELLRKEHDALADFLVALAAFDRKRLWRDLGHASLFNFLHRDLGLSTGSAFYRKTAVQLVHEFPEVIEPIREGKLCLTTVVELSKVLTRENLALVLPRFFHLSKQAAKEVAVEIKPEVAPQRMVVTALHVPAAPGLAFAPPVSPDANATGSHPFRPDESRRASAEQPPQEVLSPAVAAPRSTCRTMTVDPKTAEQSRVHITVSRAFLSKLEAARDALSHSHPGASEDEILEAGLDLLLERAAKRKGLVATPRKSPPASGKPRGERGGRYVPAHIRRAVWQRDGGRCQFPLEGGGICGSTYRVQLDHVIPWARGGPTTIDNLRCACDVHNRHAARQAYGDAVMDRYAG
jgi:hypothetical protein